MSALQVAFASPMRCGRAHFLVEYEVIADTRYLHLALVPQGYARELEDIGDQPRKASTDLLLTIEDENLLAHEIEHFGFLLMFFDFGRITPKLVGHAAGDQERDFEAGQRDRVLRVLHIEVEEGGRKEVVQTTDRE